MALLSKAPPSSHDDARADRYRFIMFLINLNDEVNESLNQVTQITVHNH